MHANFRGQTQQPLYINTLLVRWMMMLCQIHPAKVDIDPSVRERLQVHSPNAVGSIYQTEQFGNTLSKRWRRWSLSDFAART